jgi:hypothetical protein
VTLCNFQDNFCNWTPFSYDDASGFTWQWATSKQLAEGHLTDQTGSDQQFFAFITVGQTEDEDKAYADLNSPFLAGNKHPKECFTFWFEYEVKRLAKFVYFYIIRMTCIFLS